MRVGRGIWGYRMSGHNGGRHEGENAAYEARASYEEVAGMPVSCSAADAARILGISATHVQRLAAQGKLPGCKVDDVQFLSQMLRTE